MLHLAHPLTKKEAQLPGGIFEFWRQNIPHLSVAYFWITPKAAVFLWGPEQEKVLQYILQ